MHIGPEIIHDQDEACMGGQGQRLDVRFTWQCLGHEEEAHLDSLDLQGADDELLREDGGWVRERAAYMLFYLLHRASGEEGKNSLILLLHYNRFSKSRHLEELHKYQTGDKNRQYVDFQSEEFWISLTEEEAVARGTPIPDDLQLMARIASGLSCSWIMRRFEAIVFSVCTNFNEHMRRFARRATCRTPLGHR
ncbi:hypothetical protein M9H77_18138 [Catharanthus roseus]|uniref:Uncharacterized protein n=1 Tax=Catharanthus roseus TaxID=4058 RepID=A0ACC0B6J7_CATRO|nr:hypothetical protein M9H77_18138 [Catharanthus roseus]